MDVFVLLLAYGAVVTKSTDFIRNIFDKGDTAPKWVWNVVPLVLAVAYAIGWGLDASAAILALVPALADNADALTGLPGQILTGLLAFGAAGFLHEAFDALSGVATRAQAALKS
jgi:hypothetical protein